MSRRMNSQVEGLNDSIVHIKNYMDEWDKIHDLIQAKVKGQAQQIEQLYLSNDSEIRFNMVFVLYLGRQSHVGFLYRVKRNGRGDCPTLYCW